MRLRQVLIEGQPASQVATRAGWVNLSEVAQKEPSLHSISGSLLSILAALPQQRHTLQQVANSCSPTQETGTPTLPFQPASYRDFMLYESHVIDASRGFAKHFLPKVYPIIRTIERLSRRPFFAFNPKPLWYQQPIYYLGNHLAFIPDRATIPWPSYCTVLDYELELGLVLTKPLYNATPEEAEAAIGGFVLFNDVSVRNVQRAEMDSGFGPQKAKHFCNVLGHELVTADEILPRWQKLTGEVRINGQLVSRVSAQSPQFSLGEALAHVSHCEYLFPGEFFGTGTLPGGSGIENGHLPRPGDQLELVLEGIGRLSNPIGLQTNR
ncbi:fumarylacetoacetate hydrolase family protein [Runella sp. MFBS21]|uniref:fumarylacetoacetate hydrolase family protein n=1 Tax=Runella sp. MFBS21 TaxID=3034018 RepID=UPI0023F9397F|nr:fumarylacetoacetate hydrolase family protein [Runella sp. MFBS21]MDF7819960.1 fumarylacetoacetate hydrolase family protein [Runella sp. MFBS21]